MKRGNKDFNMDSFNQSKEGRLRADQSYRAKHAAEYLAIAPSTFWRWVATKEGFPQPIRLSRRCTIFSGDELEAWRNAQSKSGA
jgi:prophage regulatory protein